ncbi:MAG TPA: hypothetical protein PKO05_04590 [Thermoanaerobaculia bacterium]|jgi:hypothetical protein|nr:MAG: hypothetical protein BWX64_00642 [Acidobacteria bacterium ADurb.Bin051]HNU82689.1 hypothetical protein [Thermoanaerobaculia bacterium]
MPGVESEHHQVDEVPLDPPLDEELRDELEGLAGVGKSLDGAR